MNKNEPVLGLWDLGWPEEGAKFPLDELEKNHSRYAIDDPFLTYLKSGHLLFAKRTILFCPITKELIGPPIIKYDNAFIWTSEYIFYLKKGMLQIDDSLKKNIIKNNFKVPDLSLTDKQLLNEVISKLNYPTI